MVRPLKARTPSEHLLTLSRVGRSLERDDKLTAKKKSVLLRLLARLMTELQKEMK